MYNMKIYIFIAVFASVAEPQHFLRLRNPAPTLLHSKTEFLKQTKVTYCQIKANEHGVALLRVTSAEITIAIVKYFFFFTTDVKRLKRHFAEYLFLIFLFYTVGKSYFTSPAEIKLNFLITFTRAFVLEGNSKKYEEVMRHKTFQTRLSMKIKKTSYRISLRSLHALVDCNCSVQCIITG
jgi:hypothetical protein